jgi:hypothetical protein
MRRRLRSDDRRERARRREVAHICGARRLEDAGGISGSEGEKSERSECNSPKLSERYLNRIFSSVI